MRWFLLALALLTLSGCVGTVNRDGLDYCSEMCLENKGVDYIDVTVFNHITCHCNNGGIFEG